MTGTEGIAFFDTNVLVYLYAGDLDQRTIATRLFADHARRGRALVSTQVVQELYAAGSRKLAMEQQQLRDIAAAFLELPLVVVEGETILAAFRNQDQYKISFWDALIVAAAQSGGASVLYTEDLTDGQRYGAVVARNPFKPAITRAT